MKKRRDRSETNGFLGCVRYHQRGHHQLTTPIDSLDSFLAPSTSPSVKREPKPETTSSGIFNQPRSYTPLGSCARPRDEQRERRNGILFSGSGSGFTRFPLFRMMMPARDGVFRSQSVPGLNGLTLSIGRRLTNETKRNECWAL